MPEIYEPSPKRARRPIQGTIALNANRRRRRTFRASPRKPSVSDDLEFTLENEVAAVSNFASASKINVTAPSKTMSRIISPVAMSSLTSQLASVPQSAPRTSSTRTAPLSHVRRALILDTRTLDTEQGRIIGNAFLSQTRAFLSSLRKCGMTPDLLVSLNTASSKSNRSRPPMIPKTIHLLGLLGDSGPSLDGMCEPFLVKPAVTASKQTKTMHTTNIPTRFLANASWTIFGDLVEETVRQDQTLLSSSHKIPISITLLSNNISLFCDHDIDGAHKAALTSFWNRVRPFFHKGFIRSIELEVVEIASIKYSTTGEPQGGERAQQGDDPSLETPARTNNGSECVSATSSPHENDSIIMDEARKLDCDKTHVCEMDDFVPCIKRIQQMVAELSEADSKTNRNRDETLTNISLSITFMTNTTDDFADVARRWLTQIMAPSELKGCIVFELPEAMGGTQCTITLDATYRSSPFPADSQAAAGMLADLQQLSSCIMETVQMVPLPCVDANLLFGVPMKVTPAFQDDVDGFKEMKALVQVLLQQLRVRDAALLLHANGPDDCASSSFGPALHHTTHQTYLLVPQDIVLGSTCGSLVEASLFRYVNADQLLSVGSSELYKPSPDDELEVFASYVERALETLPNGLINPLINDGIRRLKEVELSEVLAIKRNVATKKMMIDGDDAWTDTSGVGALSRFTEDKIVVHAQTEGAPTTEDGIEVKERMSCSVIPVSEGQHKIDLHNTSPQNMDAIRPLVASKETPHLKTNVGGICSRSKAKKTSERSKRHTSNKDGPVSLSLSKNRCVRETLKACPDFQHDSMEAVPATIASLMNRNNLSFPIKTCAKANKGSIVADLVQSQDSIEEITEFPTTQKEVSYLDQLTAAQELVLGQLLVEEHLDDADHVDPTNDDRTLQNDAVDVPGSPESQPMTTDSSCEDENHIRKNRRRSFQKAAAVFLETLTDTDSDPEFVELL